MHIDVALRLKPFSHEPGVVCLIPGTAWRAQIFPTLIKFLGPEGKCVEESVPVRGPVEEFTVEQDLEKGQLCVFGKTPDGYLRYYIRGNELVFDKCPEGVEKKNITIPCNQTKSLSQERLSLGVHKLQDWTLVQRRCDLSEILPHWLRLGQMTPSTETSTEGTLSLLEECVLLWKKRDAQTLETRLRHLFMAGFEGLLNPRFHDNHQGILEHQNTDVLHEAALGLSLLSQGAELIRSLFFFEEGNTWHILPCLLPKFHAGRLVCIKTKDGDQIDLEWSKGLVRRIVIKPVETKELFFQWPKEVKKFRLRHTLAQKGKWVSAQESIFAEAGQAIFLDQFQK